MLDYIMSHIILLELRFNFMDNVRQHCTAYNYRLATQNRPAKQTPVSFDHIAAPSTEPQPPYAHAPRCQGREFDER